MPAGRGLSFRLGRIPVLMPWSSPARDRDHRLPVDGLVRRRHRRTRTEGVVLTLVFAVLFYASDPRPRAGARLGRAVRPATPCTRSPCGGSAASPPTSDGRARRWREGADRRVRSGQLDRSSGSPRGLCTPARSARRLRACARWPTRSAWSNMLLGIYNALPGLPLDGGAVLKSIVWGDHARRAPRHRRRRLGRARRRRRRAALVRWRRAFLPGRHAGPRQHRVRGHHLGVPVVGRDPGAQAGAASQARVPR